MGAKKDLSINEEMEVFSSEFMLWVRPLPPHCPKQKTSSQ